jgi:HD-GYP domain-containing protein (c-di-GMP phosphodiesterase class II)
MDIPRPGHGSGPNGGKMDRERIERLQVGAVLTVLTLPVGFFLYLRERPAIDPIFQVPTQHFYVVSAISLLALALAIAVGLASVRARQPRTFFMAAAFLMIAGIFATHGLTTSGVIVHGFHRTIVVSARLSLVLGGLMFALSAIEPSRAVGRWIGRHHGRLIGALLVGLALYIGANLVHPSLLDGVPIGVTNRRSRPEASAPPTTASDSGQVGSGGAAVEGDHQGGFTGHDVSTTSGPGQAGDATPDGATDWHAIWSWWKDDWLGNGLAAIAMATLLFASWRYYRVFSLSRLPAAAAMSVGLFFLAQSQITMLFGETWRLSWWLYHVQMLLGFLIPIGGIGYAYARGGSLDTIVEGLFLRDTLAQVERAFPEAIERLIAATEAKDPYLLGHARRVCGLAVRIGEELKLSDARLRAVANGALLHDIGKLGLPDAILQKPGKLTDDEYAVLREHTVRGHKMVAQVRSLQTAAPAIRSHHERLDGSGYPDGLAGESIPLEARIVGVADVWDALTSDRVYRPAWTRAAAQELLEREAGVQMDERCVAALFRVLDAESAAAAPASLRYRRQRRDESKGATALVG